MKKIHKLTLLLAFVLLITFIASNVFQVEANNKQMTIGKTKEKQSKYIVVLDAGHGGYDSGSLSNDESIQEKDITLSITNKIGSFLEDEGVAVVYTRTSDTVSWSANTIDDLKSRVAISEQNETDLFVSVHLNSFINSKASGFETWVNKNDKNAVNFAQLLHSNLVSLQYTKNRGIKDVNDEPLYVVSNNSAPSALLELGYISSNSDLSYLVDEMFQERIAKVIGQSIIMYLNEKQ